jgi:hypothetical protein
MATIDIGPGATDRASAYGNYTRTTLDKGNPANDTGTLDTFEIFANVNCTGVKIGTFSGSGTSWNDRDYESIGNVTAGSKQTFTGKNCDVSANDLLGIFFAGDGAKLEFDLSGGSGVFYANGDLFGSGAQTYSSTADRALSIYATGATAAAGNPYYYYLQQ